MLFTLGQDAHRNLCDSNGQKKLHLVRPLLKVSSSSYQRSSFVVEGKIGISSSSYQGSSFVVEGKIGIKLILTFERH